MDPISWLRHPTRHRILLAAESRFSATGFDAATIEQVLAAAGVSKSHLYYHFPSKDALLAGLVRLRAADLAGFAGDWPAAALTYREILRILVVERVLRPALVTEAWRSVAALVPAPLDVDAEVMRAALAPAS